MTKLFVNVPVDSLERATEFYLKLGFAINLQFSGAEMTALDHPAVHLLLHTPESFMQTRQEAGTGFVKTGLMLSLQCDHRDDVEQLFSKALQAGAVEVGACVEHELGYGRSFSDPDGHHWQLFWLGISQD